MIPLSILDLSVVTTGAKPAVALRNSIDLARHADALGYVRYWLAAIIGCSFCITVAGLPTNSRERLLAIEARSASV